MKTVNSFKTHMLFPTVIATVDNPTIPKQDHETILNSEFILTSKGNFPMSKNKYILDSVPTLKNWIQNQINRYATEVMGSGKLKFTQSWAIKHENMPQNIFTHTHANSIISGSYYIDAPNDSEPLSFNKPGSTNGTLIKYEKSFENKPWLYEQVGFASYTGRLILFPSHIEHSVMGFQTKTQRRCVLAFNTWFDGPIGTEEGLTLLE
jgi:uncharacterized protein (TIGR02466 family)